MAKTSSVQKNMHRASMAKNKSHTRKALKAIVMDRKVSFEDRISAVHKLAEMPRNSAPIRVRNRCLLTGRSRGFYRKFKLSRIALRDLGSQGLIPGLIKASW